MKISASGLSHQEITACKTRRELRTAEMAISCFHDALLAVARGDLAPEEVKSFFWSNGFDDARYYGDVVTFEAKTEKVTT